MTKEKTEEEKMQEEIAKTKIAVWALFIGAIMFLFVIAQNIHADEIKFQFKSPSFSGIGQSAHYLTIEQQEFSRREQLKADLKALEEQRKRDEENSVVSRFTRNLESRIFAQISRQIVEQLFGENPQTEGSFNLFDNIISWSSDGTYITLIITNTLDDTTTEITIPIGSFGFGS
tara:strand:- start:689 stop:1210 length:522 start_codon:yes stop_codon:yes gene_type:complete